jgi:hypothetical protein
LIDGEESIAGAVLLSDVVLVVVALVLFFLTSLAFEFFLEISPAVGVVVGRDDAGIRGNNLTVLDNDLEESMAVL